MEKYIPDSTQSLSEFIKKYTSDPDFGDSPEVVNYLTIRWNYFFNTAKPSQYDFKDVVEAWKKTHFFKSSIK